MIHYFILLLLLCTSYAHLISYEKIWIDQNKKLSIIKIQTMYEEVFKNLQLCYECEFSSITQTPMTAYGNYDQEELASHWAPQHDLYVFYVHDTPSGFAVVNHGSMIEEKDTVHDIGEFFITPLYRKKGYGTLFAQALFMLYHGVWQIRQLPETEKTSRQFWLSVIAATAHHNFQEIINHPHWPGFVQSFVVP